MFAWGNLRQIYPGGNIYPQDLMKYCDLPTISPSGSWVRNQPMVNAFVVSQLPYISYHIMNMILVLGGHNNHNIKKLTYHSFPETSGHYLGSNVTIFEVAVFRVATFSPWELLPYITNKVVKYVSRSYRPSGNNNHFFKKLVRYNIRRVEVLSFQTHCPRRAHRSVLRPTCRVVLRAQPMWMCTQPVYNIV